MIKLPNGCRCSDIAIHPKNWQTAKASLKEKWYISYRFYDAAGGTKQVTIRSDLNEIPTAEKRRAAVKDLIKQELSLLVDQGLNPITKSYSKDFEIHPSTGFIKALNQAMEKMPASSKTKESIKSALNYIGKAAEALRVHDLPICEIKRRHVKMVLDRVNADRQLSATNFNHYRAYLMMLFNELVPLEAIETNPVDKHIPKRKTTRKIKETLTIEQRRSIDKHLRERNYTFWRYLHIFFHSGSRTSELFRLNVEDVDLKRQRYKLLIKKGTEEREVWKTIKDVALPLWEELLTDGKPGQYVFSRNLKPGDKSIRPDQVNKKWTKFVVNATDEDGKKIFPDIRATFYSLKHSNTTETVTLLSEEDAARMNAHQGTGMVRKIYDTNAEERQHERLKKVNNKFA